MKCRLLVVALLCIAHLSIEQARAQSMNDTFSNNGFLDPRIWSTLSPPPTSTVTVSVTNQQLQVGMGPGIGGGGVISNCSLSGDFDVQVDYMLLNWPTNNNHSIQLGAYDLGAVGVLRYSALSPSPELYEFGPGSTAHTTTSDTSGQFRLARTGTTLSGFFRMGGSWVLVGSETVSTIPTRIHLDLGTNGTFAIGGIVVAFDNFQVNMGTPSCPQAIGLGSPGPSNPVATVSEPISTSNGNYFYQHSDFIIPGRGLPLIFERSYNSLDNYSGPLGANWTHSYNILLTANPGSAIVKWGDGHNEGFVFNGSSYLPQPGVFSTLAKNGDGTFLLTRTDQVKFTFSSTGRINTIQDKNGNAISLVYDGSENLKQITNAVGRSLTLTYDSNNRIVQVTDPIGRATIFGYDGINNLDHATDPAGGTTLFAYDPNHRVITITLPNGRTLLQNAYDSSGHVVRQTGGRGFSSTLAFSTPNPTDTTITDARGSKTVHTYDSLMRIVKITDATAGVTSFTYDANNDRTSVTNQNGKTTNFSYDSTGNVTGITDPLSNAIAFTYDAKNDLRTATNANGRTTTFTYNATENLIAIKDALTNTTAFNYDGFGQLVSKTDARGNTTNYTYDSFGNLNRITDALGHNTTLVYDGMGRLVSIMDPKGHAVTATYDPLSRLVKITDPLSNQTQFAYDPVGNLLKITDANGNATSYVYDATNNLTNVTDAMGHITRYAYDENNNRTTFTNAKGNVTAYAYDVLNRLSRITDPLSFATSYSYDPLGNVLAVTDAKGQTNHVAHDALNRLLSIDYADGKHVAYSYDANGNRVSMADSHGTTNYAYDALDRLTSVTHPGAKVVTYVYDAIGNRKSLTYPDGKVVRYSFDPLNKLAEVTDWLGRNTTYAYDEAGNLIRTLYPNQAHLALAYDDANRLTEVRNLFSRGEGEGDDDQRPMARRSIARFRFILDPVGNRTQISDGRGKVTRYGYDALNELTSVSEVDNEPAERDEEYNVTRFNYDPVGNRVRLTAPGKSITYVYDSADRLLSVNGATFAFDANGNQISKTQTATGQPVIYTYDAANRLAGVTGGKTNSTYAYDGDGNRVNQSFEDGSYNYVNDVATALPVVLQESGHDGNISYAYGLGLISESSAKFDYFYHYDGLGSVIGLTDASGKLAAAYAYDPWGNPLPLKDVGSVGTKNKFRFTAEALDPDTQLYYFRARYYDPDVARFSGRDPFPGLPGNVPVLLNRYSYAGNNPIVNIDPSGLSFWSTAWNSFQTLGDVAASAAALSVEIAAKSFVDVANFATQNQFKVLDTIGNNIATGQVQAATKLVSSVATLENVSLSKVDITDTANQVVSISNIAYSLLNLAKGAAALANDVQTIGNLQNTITVNSWIGRPIAGPAVQQLYYIISSLNGASNLGQDILQTIK